jgi:hypothetical protein
MDMRLNSFVLTLALVVTALPAQSDPLPRRGEREAVRAFYLQQISNERNGQQEDPRQQYQRQTDNQRPAGQVFAMPDTSDYSNPQDNNDPRRRSGRMSPEERRALRRQIDEVGHDIYAPRR